MTGIGPISPSDLDRLRAFRQAARQIRESRVIAEGQRVTITIRESPPPLAYSLLDRDAFRSLAMSLRLVYLSESPAHFETLCGIVRRYAPEQRGLVREIRGYYREILGMEIKSFVLVTDQGERVVPPREILETWMNAEAFHLDPDRQSLLAALRETPVEFAWSVQGTVMLLCGRVMDLDDLVADLLGEDRIQRIGHQGADEEDV